MHWTFAREVFKLVFLVIFSNLNQCKIVNYLEPRLSYNKGKTYSISTWRKKVLARDKNVCQNCFNAIRDLFRARKYPNEAPHVIARMHGGKNTLNNSITLCKFCHHYFGYMYVRYGLDYFEVIKRKNTETRIKEVRELMRKRFIRSLLRIIFG